MTMTMAASSNKTIIKQCTGEEGGRQGRQRATQQMIVSTNQHNNLQMTEVNRWGDSDDGIGQG
jgi:hypothetical protein